MAGYGSRRIEIVRSTVGDGAVKAANTWFSVVGARSSGRAICPGMFVVQRTAGSNADVDGYKTADGTTASRLIVGLVHKVTDTKGRPLDIQYLGASDDGGVFVLPVENVIFRLKEDGDGGVLSSYTTGTAAIIQGTITNFTATETNTPDPEPNDKLDSSSYNSSATVNAFQLLGIEPNHLNAYNTNKVVMFRVGSTYIAPGVL